VATHFHKIPVKEVRRETPDCISIAFDIPPSLEKEFHFSHGQNITVRATINGEEVRRSYSICSSPLDNELRIAVKKVSGGLFSEWANATLKKGDQLEIMSPTGKFYTLLHQGNKKNYVAVAAGSGITPILSIIKTVLATEQGSSFTLVYGNQNRASVIFKEELEALKNKYINRFVLHHILSREKTDIPLNNGRIDAAKCELLFSHLISIPVTDEFFLCGPEDMIFVVRDFLISKSVDPKKIHFELFTPPGKQFIKSQLSSVTDKKTPEGKSSRISVRLDGVSNEFNLGYNDDPILDAAIKTGLDLPFSCKGGVCATCRARLIEGEVSMDTNYALEPDEVKAGYILTCQSHPRSQRVVVDFDSK
jgi:ring-1,2-phenylacetyl-CoA epoxidase subunit PaaE